MQSDATMLIAGLTSLFAVSLLFLSLFVSGESGKGSKTRAVFKAANPPLEGKPAASGLPGSDVEAVEPARHGTKH